MKSLFTGEFQDGSTFESTKIAREFDLALQEIFGKYYGKHPIQELAYIAHNSVGLVSSMTVINARKKTSSADQE